MNFDNLMTSSGLTVRHRLGSDEKQRQGCQLRSKKLPETQLFPTLSGVLDLERITIFINFSVLSRIAFSLYNDIRTC